MVDSATRAASVVDRTQGTGFYAALCTCARDDFATYCDAHERVTLLCPESGWRP